MVLSIKSFILFGSVLLTGLSAGLFFAWSASVIPGNQHINSLSYLQSMQSINRAILNPIFFGVFFGAFLFLGAASFVEFQSNKIAFWFVLLSAICYLIGTIGVTGLGNVPLNNALDALHLGDLTVDKINEFRTYYESNWNRFHFIRMICSVVSFVLAVLTLFTHIKFTP